MNKKNWAQKASNLKHRQKNYSNYASPQPLQNSILPDFLRYLMFTLQPTNITPFLTHTFQTVANSTLGMRYNGGGSLWPQGGKLF